jgi:hypothetical protein
MSESRAPREATLGGPRAEHGEKVLLLGGTVDTRSAPLFWADEGHARLKSAAPAGKAQYIVTLKRISEPRRAAPRASATAAVARRLSRLRVGAWARACSERRGATGRGARAGRAAAALSAAQLLRRVRGGEGSACCQRGGRPAPPPQLAPPNGRRAGSTRWWRGWDTGDRRTGSTRSCATGSTSRPSRISFASARCRLRAHAHVLTRVAVGQERA